MIKPVCEGAMVDYKRAIIPVILAFDLVSSAWHCFVSSSFSNYIWHSLVSLDLAWFDFTGFESLGELTYCFTCLNYFCFPWLDCLLAWQLSLLSFASSTFNG